MPVRRLEYDTSESYWVSAGPASYHTHGLRTVTGSHAGSKSKEPQPMRVISAFFRERQRAGRG
jgi:hypothetical protein